MGKSIIFMAIFKSKLLVYQRVAWTATFGDSSNPPLWLSR